MSETKELRQLANNVEIIGTLKSIDLEEQVSKKGNPYVKGHLIVQSKIDDKINASKVEVFIMKSSKLYKGVKTVMDEYKALDSVNDPNEADRIRVNGEITLNEYTNSQGELVSYNQIKGVFFNRVKPEDQAEDKAIASLELVVEGFDPIMNESDLPTGDYEVRAFNVAYGPTVVPIQNMIIGSDLAEPMMGLYSENSTGRLTVQLNNYAVVSEEEVVEQAPSHGFGSSETVEGSSTVKTYVNNIEVIGGDLPFMPDSAFTEEEIETAQKIRNLALQSLNSQPSETPKNNEPTGFGNNNKSNSKKNEDPFNVEDNLPSGLDDDDMPDF